MPVYQDPERRLERPALALPPDPPFAEVAHRLSEESLRTEFCEGPVPDEPSTAGLAEMTYPDRSAVEKPAAGFSRLPFHDRAELIERIKRSQPAAWQPGHPSPEALLPNAEPEEQSDSVHRPGTQATLIPAIQLKGPITPEQAARNEDSQSSNLDAGLEIQRPRSALHAGDFTATTTGARPEKRALFAPTQHLSSGQPTRDPISPCIDIGPPRWPLPQQAPSPTTLEYTRPALRNRAPSFQSYSSGFVYKPPTSPLVQQENNDDLDDSIHQRLGSSKESRRRTLPADALQNLRSLPSGLAQAARQPSSFQMDISFSSQSREARRSVSNFLGSVSPPAPGFLRSRRTSFSGEISPLQPSSMVGSYEESILRGRMSTTPSKPVEFTAQIGALGKGDCKPKFPDHVTLSFPAVYYNWNVSESTSSSEPSPYVGQIDLEHGLPPPKRRERKTKRENVALDESSAPDGTSIPSPERRRRKRSISPSKRPPGGSYRIPQQGQLQILIKNPNKTAVKLFLIPYDLRDMETGTKTFLRQNSYSAGPIIDTPILTRMRSESALDGKPPRGERPTLRYSIHLHICCPAKGRYYLYKSIKVVFANRVPDNKERLRNELRLPEPRFSPYRPSAEIPSSPSMSSIQHGLEKENRRRSYNLPSSFEVGRPTHGCFPSLGTPSSPSPVPPIPALPASTRLSPPAALADLGLVPRVPASSSPTADGRAHIQHQSPLSEKIGLLAASDRSNSLRSSSSGASNDSAYNKLSRGDVGYGGLFARPGTPEASEGLLSRRLRNAESADARAPRVPVDLERRGGGGDHADHDDTY